MKLAPWLERLLPDASHWGLVDKHRAQYFIITALLLMIFSAGGLVLWLLQAPDQWQLVPGWLLLFCAAIGSLAWLYRFKSIPQAIQILLVVHFLVYNGFIVVTGFHQSPMILNLFYIPLIALLPGEARVAVIWSLVSVAAVVGQYILGQIQRFTEWQLMSINNGADLWLYWNMAGCVLLSGVLALAYDKTVRDMTAILAQEKKQFEKDLLTDDLTGIANKLHLERYLDATIYHSKKLNQMIGVLSINVEQFEQLIDNYGRHTSDQVLQLLGARMQNSVRGSDLVARVAGDHFVLVLPNIKREANLQLIADKIHRQLHQPLVTRKHELSLNYRIQQALYPHDGESAETLLARFSADDRDEAGSQEMGYA